MNKVLLIPALLISAFAFAQKSKLVIGTYTGGTSEGIYIYDFDNNTGDSKFKSATKSLNPSFVAVSPNQPFLYAVNEEGDSLNNGGMVSAYKFDRKKNKLRFINQQPSGGNHPCYVSIDKTGKWLIVANYSGGSFSILPLHSDGSIGAIKNLIQHTGKSVHADRQEKAHVHQAILSENNKHLFVTDLGTDKLTVYDFDEATGSATENLALSVLAGSGPRHVALHPNQKYIYLMEELSGTVGTYTYNSSTGKIKLQQTISAIPENYKGSLGAADIHVSPNGKFLYASNRGELNNIAIYKIDETTGIVSLVGFQETLGMTPRNFCFTENGNFLLAANQNSHNIAVFAVNKETGLLTNTGKTITVPNPVCLVWAK